MRSSKKYILADPGLRSLFVKKKTGKVLEAGDVYVNTVFGNTLKKIAEGGAEVFYRGEVGQDLVKDIQEDGGIITAQVRTILCPDWLTE